jgi:hypothetical protein
MRPIWKMLNRTVVHIGKSEPSWDIEVRVLHFPVLKTFFRRRTGFFVGIASKISGADVTDSAAPGTMVSTVLIVGSGQK